MHMNINTVLPATILDNESIKYLGSIPAASCTFCKVHVREWGCVPVCVCGGGG